MESPSTRDYLKRTAALPTDRAAGAPPEWAHEDFIRDVPDSSTVFSKLLSEYRDLVIEGEETYSNDDARYAEWDARIAASRARLSDYVAGIEAEVASLRSQLQQESLTKEEAEAVLVRLEPEIVSRLEPFATAIRKLSRIASPPDTRETENG